MSINEVKGSLGTYKVVKTDDGSQTLLSPAYQENCHSMSGAYQETVYNYVLGTEVLSKLKAKPSVSILEIGFATGLGFLSTLSEIKKTFKKYTNEEKSFPKKLFFISTEIDELLTLHFIEQFKNEGILQDYSLKELGSFKEVTASFELNNDENGLIYLRGELRVLIGNARETILELQKNEKSMKIDCFFHDPFSPKKNPILWTKQFFKLLFEMADEQSILGTYSSTKAVWKAMIEAGWRVKEVKGYGQKKLSTRALKKGEISPFVLEQCDRSPTEALSDTSLPKGLDPFL